MSLKAFVVVVEKVAERYFVLKEIVVEAAFLEWLKLGESLGRGGVLALEEV